MHVVTISASGLEPGRIEPVLRALTAYFDGRVLSVLRDGSLLVVGQFIGDDDYTNAEHLRLHVAGLVLRAHAAPCRGTVMAYALSGPATTFSEAARELGLSPERLSAVDQLADLVQARR